MARKSLTDEQLEALLERASHKGAQRALSDIGLQDTDAVHDIKDLRNLIDGYRELKGQWQAQSSSGSCSLFRFCIISDFGLR